MAVEGRVWVGIDAGKFAHHAVAVDPEGRTLWSLKVANTQEAAEQLVERAGKTDTSVCWAVDLTSAAASLAAGPGGQSDEWCLRR
jgi:hypothetical protein